METKTITKGGCLLWSLVSIFGVTSGAPIAITGVIADSEREAYKAIGTRQGYDCYIKKDPLAFYNGSVTITQSGFTCQRWDIQTPHAHEFGTDAGDFATGESMDVVSNFCRVSLSDGTPFPWCYTASVDKRWELCDISECQTEELICKVTTDDRGTTWRSTAANTTLQMACPTRYSGSATRQCGADGQWQSPQYINCIHSDIQDIGNKIKNIANGTSSSDDIEKLANNLSKMTGHGSADLTSGDIQSVVTSLQTMYSVLNNSKRVLTVTMTKDFLKAVDDIFSEKYQREWSVIRKLKRGQPDVAIPHFVTSIGFHLANTLEINADPVVLNGHNIVVELGKITPRDISFPNVSDSSESSPYKDCEKAVSAKVKQDTIEELSVAGPDSTKGIPYVAVLYTSIGYLLNCDGKMCLSVAYPSVSIHIKSPKEIHLNPPLELTFESCLDKIRPANRYTLMTTTQPTTETDEPVPIPPPKYCVRKTEIGDWHLDQCDVIENTKSYTKCSCSESGHIGASSETYLKEVLEFLVKFVCLVPVLGVVFRITWTFCCSSDKKH